MRFGIEYTFLADKTKEPSVQYLANKFQRMGFKRAYEDSGDILEVPSPPHRSMAEAKRFWDKLNKARKKHRLPIRRSYPGAKGETIVEGTGGGHVNVELPKGRLNAYTADRVLWLMACYPWVAWVFMEFGDEDNARCVVERAFRGAWGLQPDNKYGMVIPSSAVEGIRSEIIGFYDCAVTYRSNRMEFRCFDAPRTWKQSKEHIEFAVAIMKLAKTKETIWAPHGDVIREKDFYKVYTRKQVVKEFKELCKILGLQWKTYKKYMRNFDDRLAFGKLI